jgi:hypothetical protein
MVEADPHRHSGLREGTAKVALSEADRCLVDPDDPCPGVLTRGSWEQSLRSNPWLRQQAADQDW